MVEEKIFLDFQQGKIDSLYKNMYGKLILYASRCLGEDASFMSEDCVQDAIFKTYQMRGELQSAATLKSYLYACVHNQAVSILRRQTAQANYLEQQTEEAFQLSILEQDVLDLLFDAIQNLPERYRRLFDLSFEQGLKNAEVAAMLNVSESAVKKQKATLIKLVREEIIRRTGNQSISLSVMALLLNLLK